ncbi:hypothetical protein [Halapricum salinum]|uniref:HAMP domain-containing protein n=1 Tax=Halapricum salinum TaxID=1457250 RepID=A0A4D6HCT5_9EURY|nr:hypothetical protein [Halapricum salinum]QCC51620.1 hypothetical protein DV733_10380 [Halapricum salinum]
MTFLRRYLGVRHRILVWTLVLVGGGTLVIQRVDVQGAVRDVAPDLATYAGLPTQAAILVVVWLFGVVLFRRGERLSWKRLRTKSPFSAQREDRRRPPLQNEYKRKTVTAEVIGRGFVRQQGVRVETLLDGLSKPLALELQYVGSGGREEGIRTGNDALDDQFVLTVEAGSNLREVFDPEVQSALMDISIPGTLRVTNERVVYDVPFTRVRPEELGAVARAVATMAARLERLARKGHR